MKYLVFILLVILTSCSQKEQVMLTVKEKTKTCTSSNSACYYLLSDGRLELLKNDVNIGDKIVLPKKE
jgi:hypothetical protein